MVYPDLEVFKADKISVNSVIRFIESNGGHLREISFEADTNYFDTFADDSLIFIRTTRICGLRGTSSPQSIIFGYAVSRDFISHLQGSQLLDSVKKKKILIFLFNL